MKKIKIKEKFAGERIDKFLHKTLVSISRSQLQKLIKDEYILVNDKNVSTHYVLKEDDTIAIKKTTNMPEIKKISEKKRKQPPLTIIDETNEYIIINKPAGVIVHGAPGIKEKTLVDTLLQKYPSLSKIGEDPQRPAIVHRLDKDASGLMVIPKTQDSFDNLKKQFQKRTINKKYIVLVYGEILKEADEIRFPIRRSSAGYKMAALPKTVKMEKNKEGKIAISEFKIIKKFINYTLIEVKIKTGRTHQVRVHMSAYGHPLVGDNLYGTQKTKEANKKLNMTRIFLVADELGFTDLQGIKRNYKIDLPEELKGLMKKIK
ncbi:MAG: RluA family pseudouridine synthase [bacterium]